MKMLSVEELEKKYDLWREGISKGDHALFHTRQGRVYDGQFVDAIDNGKNPLSFLIFADGMLRMIPTTEIIEISYIESYAEYLKDEAVAKGKTT